MPNGQTFGHSSNIPMRSRLEVAYSNMAAGRLEAELLCNLPLLLLAAKATASEKELRALPVGRRILLAALLPQRCFTSMKKAWLLRALSPQGDVDLFSLLKSDSVVRAAEMIAYLVE